MESVSVKSWNCLYPLYFFVDKTREQGRRLPKQLCVKYPQIPAIHHVLKGFGIPCVMEANKKHPRDFFLQGRVKYRLADDNGQLYNSKFTSSRGLGF